MPKTEWKVEKEGFKIVCREFQGLQEHLYLNKSVIPIFMHAQIYNTAPTFVKEAVLSFSF